MDEKKNILSIKDLSVHYFTVDMGECHAVNHVSFDLGDRHVDEVESFCLSGG